MSAKLNRTRLTIGACACVGVTLLAATYGLVVPASAQQTSRPSTRPPLADEYYAVKSDWITGDRSLLTVKHTQSGSCYVLLYPTGDTLMPVEKDRCTTKLPSTER